MTTILTIIGVVAAIAAAGFVVQWTWTLFKGKCPYCKSEDFTPDTGPYFYCNNCRRKF